MQLPKLTHERTFPPFGCFLSSMNSNKSNTFCHFKVFKNELYLMNNHASPACWVSAQRSINRGSRRHHLTTQGSFKDPELQQPVSNCGKRVTKETLNPVGIRLR